MEMTPEAQPTPASSAVEDSGGLLRPDDIDRARTIVLRDPVCRGFVELSGAKEKRARVARYLASRQSSSQSTHRLHCQSRLSESPSTVLDDLKLSRAEEEALDLTTPLFYHLSQGLALTTGSALGSTPPDTATCLAAFLVPNKAHLTAGARAWSKHAHRSQPLPSSTPSSPSHIANAAEGEETLEPEVDAKSQKRIQKEKEMKLREQSDGWWGRPSGPVAVINQRALALFWKVVGGATWRNLHWLPHRVLVYEVRVEEGYGMRWSQDRSALYDEDGKLKESKVKEGKVRVAEEENLVKPWIFRGFVEPMMDNGHEVGWRHPI